MNCLFIATNNIPLSHAYLWFIVSIGILIVIARKNILLALIISSLVLGIFTLGIDKTFVIIINTLTSLDVLLFSSATGIIAYIGGLLSESGAAKAIVRSLGNRPKISVSFIPALFGTLPMPGGAILSAPIVDKALPDVSPDVKSAINVYFRHVVFLVYPLQTTLLFLAIFTNLNLFDILAYIIPMFPISVSVGYFYYLHKIKVKTRKTRISYSILLFNLIPIILPVFIYAILQQVLSKTTALVFSVLFGLILALLIFGYKKELLINALKIKPHFFFVLTLLMWLYMEIAMQSLEKSLSLANIGFILSVIVIPFILGFLLGRMQFPALVGISLYLAQFKFITPKIVAMSFVFSFLGYVMSPVHPCVIVTAEYFHVNSPSVIKRMMIPVLVTFAFGIVVFLLVP